MKTIKWMYEGCDVRDDISGVRYHFWVIVCDMSGVRYHFWVSMCMVRVA